MIKFENTNVMNINNAIRGLRNSLNSWDKSDTKYCTPNICLTCNNRCGCKDNNCLEWDSYRIGDNDLNLALRLIKGGTEHRKFLRQIFISVDITAPLYWWKQFDTYKINVTANSTSTMHKIHSKEFTIKDFSCEDMSKGGIRFFNDVIEILNIAREYYLKNKNKEYWFDMIKLLPESYNQKRTITMNYENILNICKQREGHKLNEWNDFIEWAYTLPYVKIFLGEQYNY